MRSTRARSSRDVRGVDRLRDAAADELVEHRAQLVDLVGFLDARSRARSTPRFFSSRTRPDSSSARKASRTGPRDTPSSVGDRGLVQLAARRAARRRGSSARARAAPASAASSTARSAMASGRCRGAGRAAARRRRARAARGQHRLRRCIGMLRLDAAGCRLSTICNIAGRCRPPVIRRCESCGCRAALPAPPAQRTHGPRCAAARRRPDAASFPSRSAPEGAST